jgi:hypothetical protein
MNEDGKMAARDESVVCIPTSINSEITSNQSVNCHLCEELKLELQQARQELLSYAKVIEILRSELTIAAQRDQHAEPETIKQSALQNDQLINPKQLEEWQQIPPLPQGKGN